jgi:hypothetical protein
MSVPDSTRNALKEKLRLRADELGWATLSPADKSHHYEAWTKDPEIGGRLGRYMEQGQVRVYIKDTLLKDYTRSRLSDPRRPFRVLGISESIEVVETYTKPHGRRLGDGRVICWGRADDWKTILMALHERTFGHTRLCPHAAIFLYSLGRFHEIDARALVEEAATKLGIEKIVWLE